MRHSITDVIRRGSVLLAPMAGVNDAAFRGICRRHGADLSYTEMVSAAGLHHGGSASTSLELLTYTEDERPVAVQLFGSSPELLVSATRLVHQVVGENLALIDINMGCPVAKVVNKNEGCALMRDHALAARLMESVIGVSEVPVTAKFRSGWDNESIDAVEFGLRLQQAGAHAVAVHGRTRGQLYRGKADWTVIADVKAALEIPVYGSGDVYSPSDISSMFDQTGVDAVMIARGGQGNPWIFSRYKAIRDGLSGVEEPSYIDRLDTALMHARELRALVGDHQASLRMRKHVMWYTHGLSGATFFRERINASVGFDDLVGLLEEYREYLL